MNRSRTDLLNAGRSLLSKLRFGQFLFVGFIGMLIDSAVLALLVSGWQFSVVLAALCSKEASIAVMFLLNEYWTFVGERGQEVTYLHQIRRFIKSNAVRAVGAGVGIVVLSILHYWFGIWYILANIIGIGIGFSFNYALESLITWQVYQE